MACWGGSDGFVHEERRVGNDFDRYFTQKYGVFAAPFVAKAHRDRADANKNQKPSKQVLDTKPGEYVKQIPGIQHALNCSFS